MRGLKLIIALLSWLFLLPLSGQDIWNNVIITASEDQAYATAASDIDNSVIVVGMASSDEAYSSPIRPYAGGGSDGFVAKYDDAGTLIWSTYIGSSEEDACGDVVVDELGNIYVTGYVESFWSADEAGLPGDHQGGTVGNDAFVCKLSPSGVIQWFHVFGGNQEDTGIALSYFRGQLYMAMNAHFNDFFIDGVEAQGPISSSNRRHYTLLAMNSETGAREWFWFLGSERHDFDVGQFQFPHQVMNHLDLEVDGSGVYLAALCAGKDLNMSSNELVEEEHQDISIDDETDPYIIKFNHKGEYVYSEAFSNSYKDNFYLKIALDCDRVYATVNVDYQPIGSDYNVWLFALSKSNGSSVFSERYTTTFFTETEAIIYDLKSDGKGRLLAVGTLRETLSYTETSGGGGSIYSSGYNFFLLNIRASDGRVISSHEGGGNGDDMYLGITVAGNSTMSLVGSGKQGDEILGANTGNILSLNGTNNILIRSRATLVADLSSCCRKTGLIKTVSADPEYFCDGETVTLTAEGDYDEINWFIEDGGTWTPISSSEAINATSNVNVYAIGNLDCGIADTSEVLILMHDKTDPAFSNCPSNIGANTDPGTCEFIYTFGTPIATDNCAAPSVTRTDGNGWNSGDALPVGVHTFSYEATDEGGLTATCSYQVEVTDGQDPNAVGPSSLSAIVDANCEYQVPDLRPSLSLSDNCSLQADLTFDQTPSVGTVVTGDQTVNFTVTDEAGNEFNGSIGISPSDTISPMIGVLPATMSKEVDSDCNYVLEDFTSSFSGTDNCTASDDLIWAQSPSAGTTLNGYGTVQQVTMTLTDEAGNTSSSSFDVELEDSIDPVPDATLIAAVISECSYTETTVPTATDNCAGSILGTTSDPLTYSGEGSYTITWTFTDDNGNSATQTQTITIDDVTAPVPDVTSLPDVTGECAVTVSAAPTATDNCEGTITGTTSDPLTYTSQGTYTITWIYDDGNGNTASQIQNVSVNDTEAPNISLPSGGSISENNDTGLCGAVVTWSYPSFSDNCTLTDTLTWGPVSGSFLAVGVHYAGYQIIDAAGNTTLDSLEITVLDLEDPVVGAMTDIEVYTDLDQCGATVNWTLPEITDNCAVIDTTIYDNWNPTGPAWPGDFFPVGNSEIRIYATDAAGRDDYEQFFLEVIDGQDPVFLTFPNDTTVFTDAGECHATVSWTLPTYNDNCAVTDVVSTYDPGDMFVTGTHVVEYTIEDAEGNQTVQSFTITVQDNEDPVITVCPSSSAYPFDADCEFTLSDFTSVVNVEDNCTSDGDITITQSPASGTVINSTTTIIITATDEVGNSASCSFDVMFSENIAPTPDDPLLPTVSGECSVTVGVTPTATDNCEGSITGTTSDPLTYTSQGTYTITWIYEDGNGNSSSQTQTVVVDDTTAPVPDEANLSTINEECSATVTPPTATDNCEGSITGTTSDPLTYSSEGTYTITWNYEDGNGNSSSQTQTVIIDDVTAPIADSGSLATVMGECSVTATPPTATDNCEGSITGTTSDPLTYTSQGTYTITWIYDDGNGNSSSQEQTIEVNDTTAPVPDVTDLPDIAGECSATASFPTATDNCEGVLVGTTSDPLTYATQGSYTITWTYEDGNGNSVQQTQMVIVDDVTPPTADVADLPDVVAECAVMVLEPTAIDNCEGSITGTTTDATSFDEQGTYTITWTYDDGNGNTALQTQTVIIDDTTAPVPDIANLPDATGQCEVTVTAPSATDNCEGAITGITTDPLTYSNQGTYTITWIYDDGNGNSSTQDQTVIVQDTENPVITDSPEDIQRSLDDNCRYTLEDLTALLTASDLCDSDVDIVQSPSPGQIFTGAGTIIPVSFIVSDDSGNSTSTSMSIELIDTTSPTITCPADMSVDADPGACSAIVSFSDPVATDGCGTVNVIRTDGIALNSGDAFPAGTTVLTYQATDESGNTASCAFSIVVADEDGPIISGPTTDEPDYNSDCEVVLTNYVTLLTYSDGCSAFENLTSTQTPAVGTTVAGPTLVTVTIVDEVGNESDHDIMVTPQDVTPPVFDEMDDVQRPLNSSCEYLMEDFTGIVGVNDNCSGIINLTQTPAVNTPFSDHGTIVPVTVYAEDTSGNVDSLTFNIELEDVTPPSIDCPNDTTVYSTAAGCEVYIEMESAVATDACQTVFPTNNYNGTGDASDFYDLGNTIISWSTTDDQNFLSTCVQLVTVIDTVAPVIEEITEVVVDMFGCTYELGDFTSYVLANDNCTEGDDLSITQDLNGGQISGPTPLEFIVTDASGNSSLTGFTVIPVNVVAPVIDCYNSLSVVLPEGDCEMEVSVPAPTATDDCGDATVTNTINGTSELTLTVGLGEHEVTWIAIDAEGNSSECVITVNVTPEVPVEITCPDNVSTLAAADQCGATVMITDPEVNGFCNLILTNDFNGTDDASGFYEVGTTEVTFIASGSGEASCSFTVEVLDITSPEMECPSDISQCGTSVEIESPVLGDACGMSALTNDFNELEDASGEYPSGETIVTWTASDESGNTSTCSTTVSITEIDIEADAGPDAILDFAFEYQLQATLPTGAIGTWSSENEGLIFSDLNDPMASVSGLALGNNVLIWTVDHGLCGVMEDEMSIFTRDFLIPTGFSPNGDNVNDTYVIRGIASLGGVAIQVFDRWGKEVYATEEYDNSWDGSAPSGNILPMGTYFYIITLKERDEILRGSLELKK